MFKFLQESTNLANNYNYLDRLYRVYPLIANIRRNIDEPQIEALQESYTKQDNLALVKQALALDLFPIKDSYVAFLKRYPKAIELNPSTIDRISGEMYSLGWERILQNITDSKETNRQMGNLFRNWLLKKELGVAPLSLEVFTQSSDNAILDGSDKVLKDFACQHFGYSRNKGLDLIARFNQQYVIGEAKFLTDCGGHQNAQFADAITTLEAPVEGATAIAILDGVLFIEGNNKMFQSLHNEYSNKPIFCQHYC